MIADSGARWDETQSAASRNALSSNIYGRVVIRLPRGNRVESDVAAGATNTVRPLTHSSEQAERG